MKECLKCLIICIDSDGELQDIIEDEISSSSNVHGIVERRPYEQNQKGIATVMVVAITINMQYLQS